MIPQATINGGVSLVAAGEQFNLPRRFVCLHISLHGLIYSLYSSVHIVVSRTGLCRPTSVIFHIQNICYMFVSCISSVWRQRGLTGYCFNF